MAKDITFSIPEEIFKKLEKKVNSTDFDSIEEYLNFILKQVCEEESNSQNFDEEESEIQKQRLKDLGYL